jgi:ubiquinone/menaquinone biosynthesis C-methylase UbiE
MSMENGKWCIIMVRAFCQGFADRVKMDRSMPPGAGKSSFDLVDAKKVFGELRLKRGMTFLDMACGKGEYALAASEIIGSNGLIHAIDLWEEGIAELRRQVSDRNIPNIRAKVADLRERIPIPDDRVDVCLMATVLHDLVETGVANQALKEAARVLKSNGSLVVVEFKKIDGPPGPPIHIRLTPEEVEHLAAPYGFVKRQVVDVGSYNYMMTFVIKKMRKPE